MSWKIDKLEVTDDAMGGAVIDVKELSAGLITRLESPFPQQGQSDDWTKLNAELNRFYQSDEEIVIVQSSTNPIFRENELNRTRNPEIMTQFKHISDIGDEYSPNIFIQIDYSNFEDHYTTIERAQQNMNSWCKYINERFSDFSKYSPELIIHLCSSEDESDAVINYNKVQEHRTGVSSHFTDETAPTIIIDCGTLERHINNESEINHIKPEFNLLYSLFNFDESPKEEIINALRKIDNGFAILHRATPGMDIVIKILELSCKLAAKYIVYSSGSNLIDDFLNQSFFSTREVQNSKTVSISTKVNEEKGIIPKNMIHKFSREWRAYRGLGIYNELKRYDDLIENLDYSAQIDIREYLEKRKNRLEGFVLKSGLYSTDESTQIAKRRLFRNANLKKDEDWNFQVQVDRSESFQQIKKLISNKGSEFNLDDLIGNTADPITATPPETAELFEILYNLTYHQANLYYRANALHHPPSVADDEAETARLNELYDQGIKFTLIQNIYCYTELKDWLDKIKSALNLCENQKIKDLIYNFFNLEPNEGDEK